MRIEAEGASGNFQMTEIDQVPKLTAVNFMCESYHFLRLSYEQQSIFPVQGISGAISQPKREQERAAHSFDLT